MTTRQFDSCTSHCGLLDRIFKHIWATADVPEMLLTHSMGCRSIVNVQQLAQSGINTMDSHQQKLAKGFVL